jgi:hypothetical protein
VFDQTGKEKKDDDDMPLQAASPAGLDDLHFALHRKQ